MKQSRAHTTLINKHEKLKEDFSDLQEQIRQRDLLIKSLRIKIKSFGRAGRKSNRKEEVNEDVKKAVTVYCKDHLFRIVKFMASPEDVEHVTSLAWEGVKDEKKLEQGSDPLDEAEFVDIYAHVVKRAIGNKRQYLQVRGAKACNGK